MDNNMEKKPGLRTKSTYHCLFHPKSIVVIGAGNNILKPGGRVFYNILENGYAGDLWAVNPKTPDVQGRPAFKTIQDLPGPPDLAIVAIPSGAVLPAMQSLADKGTGAVIVLTSGFGEKNAQGKALEQEMLAIGKAAGMDIIGPNCSGFMTRSYKGKFAGILPDRPGRAVDIISGSGATVDYIMEVADRRGLSFGTAVNLGNSIQYGVEDLIAMYDEHYGPEDGKVLLVYLEAVRKPALLLRHARSLMEKGCTVIAVKSGNTPDGSRAAASHTGAMANSDTAVQALMDKAGIIRVGSRADMIDTACAAIACRGRLPGTAKVCVLTDAGGPGVMMSDEISRQGLSMARFSPSTLSRLEAILPPEAAFANPIDCGASRNEHTIEDIITLMGREEKGNVDAIAVIIGNSLLTDNAPIYEAIGRAMKESPIPVAPVFSSLTTAEDLINRFIDSGAVFFQDEVSLAKAMALLRSRSGPEQENPALSGYDRDTAASVLDGKQGILSAEDVHQLLKAAGFRPVPQTLIKDRAQAAAALKDQAFPAAVKVLGPLHKTDSGGVRLNVPGPAEALAAFDDMMAIDGAQGVLVQPMVTGTEMILGISREEGFGHLVMFGIGGIFTEVLKDVSFGLTPLTPTESLDMVRGIKGVSVLSGLRGQKGVSLEAAADCLRRLSLLATDFPQIKEMDINPLKGNDEALFAVDVRIILD
jgi:acetyltransferase